MNVQQKDSAISVLKYKFDLVKFIYVSVTI